MRANGSPKMPYSGLVVSNLWEEIKMPVRDTPLVQWLK
jgi:hypothetical protein